ncbi:hypothetical protein MC885_004816 [Smutsia gigantea]|nr:hypothetical protein MC885_004816 [Smutsia gigantea]
MMVSVLDSKQGWESLVGEQMLPQLSKCTLGGSHQLDPQRWRHDHPRSAEEMSTIGSSEGFQLVSLKQEEDDQSSETDQLSREEGDPAEDPEPTQISRQPSVTESTLYPNPYHQPYISRKYFVTRPGAIETAVDDLKGHIAKTSGETIQGFWLLTEIDHWNNEKERILLITDKTLLICKYDFIMLSCVQSQRIPLSAVSCVCLGKFAFPGMSLDK